MARGSGGLRRITGQRASQQKANKQNKPSYNHYRDQPLLIRGRGISRQLQLIVLRFMVHKLSVHLDGGYFF